MQHRWMQVLSCSIPISGKPLPVPAINSPGMPASTACLTDFMLAPPLSALGAMLLGLSLALIADTIGLKLFRKEEGIFRALYFFGGLLLVSWLILLLCICGLASQGLLQGLGAGMVIAAAILAWRRRKEPGALIRRLRRQAGIPWLVLLGLVLLLIALSPPTDADSLDYHLGVPVQVLRTGGLGFDARELHYQMFGFGEMLNLLGLANGCASLGAFLQLLSLGWMLLACLDFMRGDQSLPALMLVLGMPALIALLPGSKHLLTGACCTTVCFLYFLKYGRAASLKGFLLALAALLFAIGIKYSFLISGGLLAVYALLRNESRIFPKLLSAAGPALLFCGPLFLFKLYRFHDPLAPFGTGAWGNDPVVTWFCGFVRNYTESGFRFPFSVLVPSHYGAVSSVLGWGFVMLILCCIVCFRAYKAEVAMILLLCTLTLLLGQATSRFFIEPCLWALPLWLSFSARHRLGRVVTRIGQAQFFLTLPLSLYLAWSLGQGVLSGSQQDAVMSRNGSFYDAAKWVNATLPHDALLLTDIRSRALLAMPVFPIEYHYARNVGKPEVHLIDSLLGSEYGLRYIAVIDPDSQFIRKYCTALVAGPRTFRHATRNPFNRGSFRMSIFRAKAAD